MVAGLALVAPDRALVFTRDASLFIVQLGSAAAQQAAAAALKPTRLQGSHADIRAVVCDHRSGLLVVAGRGGASKVCPGITLSLWSFESGQLKLRRGVGSPKVSSEPDLKYQPWSISLSPDMQHVAIAAAPGR